MDQEVCNARKVRKFGRQVNLADGTKLHGRFIGRSEKLSVLLGNKAISVITINDKPRVIAVTNALEFPYREKR